MVHLPFGYLYSFHYGDLYSFPFCYVLFPFIIILFIGFQFILFVASKICFVEMD